MSLNLAGCVILDKSSKIFLLHRNINGFVQWELPGGKIDENEDADSAAKRELQEELGIAVNLKKRLGEAHFIENDIYHYYTWFLAEVQSGAMTICEPEKFDDLRSFSVDEMSKLKLSNNMVKLREAMVSGQVKITQNR